MKQKSVPAETAEQGPTAHCNAAVSIRSWAMATLLVAERGIEIDPDEIAGIGAVVTRLRCQQAVPTRVQNGDFLA